MVQKLIDMKFLGKELVFMYYKYLNEYHVAPVDIDQIFEGLDYLDVTRRIQKYFSAIS